MSKTAVVTTRVSEDISAALDTLSEKLERSRAWLVAKAIERYVKEETEFLAFVQVGVDDIEAGRFYTQEEVEARFLVKREDRDAA